MLNDELIERVVSRFPNLKVIFLARDPLREHGRSYRWAYVFRISAGLTERMLMK